MAYDYIERFYGTRFKPGMRILFTEYNDKLGTVMRSRGDPQYVSVKFDDGQQGRCHPGSLKIITPEQTRKVGQDPMICG